MNDPSDRKKRKRSSNSEDESCKKRKKGEVQNDPFVFVKPGFTTSGIDRIARAIRRNGREVRSEGVSSSTLTSSSEHSPEELNGAANLLPNRGSIDSTGSIKLVVIQFHSLVGANPSTIFIFNLNK